MLILDFAMNMTQTWTILKMIEWLSGYLNGKGVPESRLNAEHLLSHTLGISRMDLYLQFERILNPEELASLKPLIERRAAREPLQYIIGNQPFRNVDIKVNRTVLIPRPETEIVVEEVLDHIPADANYEVLELGVGSGAISAALASERKKISITGTEISGDAIEIALENLVPFKDRINVLLGDLFEPVNDKKFDIIVSNPPYCRLDEWPRLQPEVKDFEPKEALVAGEDGLDFYRRILNDATKYLTSGGWLILEVGDRQMDKVVSLAEKAFEHKNIMIRKDLNQRDRVLSAQYNHPPL